jgi:acyl carrier protein
MYIMTFEELKKIIVDTLGCEEDKVTPEATLMTDLEADSLDLVELHMALEDATGAKIPDDEIAKLQTVNDILTYIKENAA